MYHRRRWTGRLVASRERDTLPAQTVRRAGRPERLALARQTQQPTRSQLRKGQRSEVSSVDPQRIVALRPFVGSLSVQALSSAGNFALTVAVARNSSAQEFGDFAVSITIYVLLATTMRAAVLESLSRSSSRTDILRGLGTALWVSLVPSTICSVYWIATGSVLGLIVAISIPGLIAYDYARTTFVLTGRGGRAIVMESIWMCASLLALFLSSMQLIPLPLMVCVWAFTPAAITAIVLAADGDLDVLWRNFGKLDDFSWAFATDSLLGSGSSQVAIIVLGSTLGPAVVGAVRGAGTLLSPVNIMSNALRPVLVRQVATETGWRVRHSFFVTLVATALLLPAVVLVLILPDSWGVALLGETWTSSQLVLVPIALESILGLIAGVAFAGVRVHGAPAQVLRTRTALGAFRIGVVVTAGIIFGLVGAAWALPAVSLLGATIWWASFVRLSATIRKGTTCESV